MSFVFGKVNRFTEINFIQVASISGSLYHSSVIILNIVVYIVHDH